MELRVKAVCREKGISVTGLAGRMNISKVTLSQAVNGNPTVGTLEKIAAALGVGIAELFEAPTNICARCGNRIHEVSDAAENQPETTTPPPPQETKTGISLLGFVEQCTDKATDNIGLIGLNKHLKAYGGDGVLISDVDDKFYDGFIKYLKTARKSQNPAIANFISNTYQKRMKSCLDDVLATARTDFPDL